ncbi:MAG: hypothetical protein ACPLSA_04675 [Caldanaerobacter sp.]
MKKRIVLEVDLENYSRLLTLKKILDVEWRDFMIAGAVYYIRELNIEEELSKIRNMLTDQKNSEEEV